MRKINEDNYREFKHKGIWVVADGMGGHDSGDLASRSVVESLEKVKTGTVLNETLDQIRSQLGEVNQFLQRKAAERGPNRTIGSTVVVMVVHQEQCAFLWAGDSRLYRLRAGRLERLTRDHSQVQAIIDLGMLKPEDAEGHPAANTITRAVGAFETIDLEGRNTDLQSGDVYLLCSDGLYKELSEEEIAGILEQRDCRNACNDLVDLALKRRCRDNVTALVIDVWSTEKTMLRENV
ncbi:MAG: PP2C family protein-serine/threonine phosphatase [Methylococcales bacterium]